jgi:hypothetical protein
MTNQAPAAPQPPLNGEPSPAQFDAAATLKHVRRLVSLDIDVFEDLSNDHPRRSPASSSRSPQSSSPDSVVGSGLKSN